MAGRLAELLVHLMDRLRFRTIPDTGEARREILTDSARKMRGASSELEVVGHNRFAAGTTRMTGPQLTAERPIWQKSFTYEEYVDMWEAYLGRRLTTEEHDILADGCNGMVNLRLSRKGPWPPSKLAFGARHPKVGRRLGRADILDNATAAFNQARKYQQHFDEILAQQPATTEEFMALVRAHPELSRLDLDGLEDELPPGNPSNWETTLYAKRLWSGQGSKDPNPKPFESNPETGQSNMTLDKGFSRPGKGTNFSYGWYDPTTETWWEADHNNYSPKPPMVIHQSTKAAFFVPRKYFDTDRIFIAFAPKNLASL